MGLTLSVLPEILAVCRLPAEGIIPPWAIGENLFALVRTKDEMSIVCLEANVPQDVQSERDWRALKVQGPLDFSLVGILADFASILAEVQISIFAISTYDTDYLLVKENQLGDSLEALRQAGHEICHP